MNTQRRRYNLDLSRYYRTPSVQVSLGVVLSFLIVAFFVAFAIRPTLLTIARLQKEIAESKKTLQTLESKVKTLNNVNRLMEKIKPIIPKIDAAIPTSEAGYGEFTLTVGTLASQSGVTLESMTIGSSVIYSKLITPFKPDKKQEVIDLPYTIKVSGNYVSCVNFLQNLFMVSRIANITSMTISKESLGKQVSNSNTSMTISGATYYLANKAMIEKAIELKKDKK